jgi:hypothetical protein
MGPSTVAENAPVLFAIALPLFGILFEAPLTAAAVAGGAVSVPIIIHLLNRKRFKIHVWAAMRFLLAAQKKNSRRMRLEQIILLVVRCLVLLLIALAMIAVTPWAEAAWRKLLPESVKKLAHSGRRAHKVLVIDGSFSMAFRGEGDKTSFERARTRAAEIVRDAPSGDAFSVVLMSSASQLVVSEPSESTDKVIAAIEGLRQPHTGADLGGTFTSVAALLKDSPPKYTRKEVFFFTDLQQSTWIAQHSTALNAALQTFKERKVDTVFVDVGEDDAPNLAVTDVALLDDVATTARPTIVRFTLHNYAAKTRDKVRMKFFVAGGRGPDHDGPFELGDPKQERSDGPFGAGQDGFVSFSYHFDKPGDYVVQLQVENDGLKLDDVRSAVVRVRKDTPVLLVNGRPYGDRFDQSAEWLRLALNPFDDERLTPPANISARPTVITPADFANEKYGPDRRDLASFDCVFLCDVPSVSEAEANRLETFVRSGGGLVVCLGEQVQARDYNANLYRGGDGLLPVPLVGPRVGNAAYHFKFSPDPDWGQPPLKAFSTDRDQGSLLAARFHHYYELGAVKTGVKARVVLGLTHEMIPGKETEARGVSPPSAGPFLLDWQPPVPTEGKPAAKSAAARMRGRVLVIAGPVNADWGNWPGTHGFPPLMQELLNYAAAGRLREQTVDAGRPLELFLSTPARGVNAVVHTPTGQKEKATVTDFGDGSHLRFTGTETSGIYRVKVTVGGKSQEHFFAVNVPARNDDRLSTECDLKRTNQEELAKTYPALDYLRVVREPGRRVPRPADDNATEEVVFQPLGTTIARWLLLVVLGLALVEVILAWAFAHHTGAPADDAADAAKVNKARVWALRVLPCVMFAVLLGVGAVLVHDSYTQDFLGFLPEGMRHGAERALKVPAPAPGEKPMWRLEYTSYFWDDRTDPWLAGIVGVAALAMIVFVYRQERGRASTRDRFVLGALRLGLLAMLLGVFLPQLRLWFDRQGLPNVVVLIDDSFSMSAMERYGDPNDRDAADKLAKEAERMARVKLEVAAEKDDAAKQKDEAAQLATESPEKTRLADDAARLRKEAQELRQEAAALDAAREEAARSDEDVKGEKVQRLQLVCALLTREDGRWLASLLTQREFKVHIYRCSNQTVRLASLTEPRQLKDGVKAVLSLNASQSNDASHLGAAVRKVIKDLRANSLAAVVMLTDGVTTEGEETLAHASQAAVDVGVPLYFVGLGDAHDIRDVSLQELKADDTVFVNDRLEFSFYVVAKGYKNLTLPVTLREKGGKKLDEQQVTVDGSGKPKKVKLHHRPKEPGEKTYVIEVPVQEKEVETENNRLEHVVSVRESATIKVLYVEGYRRYEYHFLKTLLERESDRVKGNRIVKLRVRLLEADDAYQAMEGRDADGEWRALKDFPTRKELEGYHVVILGDVNPKPDKEPDKTHEFLKNLAEFVEKRGGGLLMVAGERYSPFAYKESPLKDILPIEVTADRNPDETDRNLSKGFRPELTPVGREHPIFRFNTSDDKDSEEIWKKLRELYWYAEGFRAKRAAEVLVVHPGVRRADKPAQGGHPLAVQQFVGAGRAMFLGLNETWRWGWREDQAHYNTFWIQTIRYLARSKLGRVRLDLDRQTPYRRGEPIRVSVRYPDDAPAPDEDKVVVMAERRTRGPGGAVTKWELTLSKLPGSRATFEDALTQTPEGEYKFWLEIPSTWKAKLESANYVPRAECRVVGPPDEMYGLRMNADEMREAASVTGGGFYTLADADKLPAALPAGEPGPRSPAGNPLLLWNGVTCFLIALLLLTTEWLIRKRKNLL